MKYRWSCAFQVKYIWIPSSVWEEAVKLHPDLKWLRTFFPLDKILMWFQNSHHWVRFRTSKCLLCHQKWHIIVKHKFPKTTQRNLQSRMFPLPLGGTYMKPRVNQIRNFWWWVKNCTEAIINNMDKYPDIKQEGRDTGLDGNHDSCERKVTNSLSSHGFAIPKSSRTYIKSFTWKGEKILNC